MKQSTNRYFVAYQYKENKYDSFETTSYAQAEAYVRKLRARYHLAPYAQHITFVRFSTPTNFYVDFLPINHV